MQSPIRPPKREEKEADIIVDRHTSRQSLGNPAVWFRVKMRNARRDHEARQPLPRLRPRWVAKSKPVCFSRTSRVGAVVPDEGLGATRGQARRGRPARPSEARTSTRFPSNPIVGIMPVPVLRAKSYLSGDRDTRHHNGSSLVVIDLKLAGHLPPENGPVHADRKDN